jgi:hypothetical protein
VHKRTDYERCFFYWFGFNNQWPVGWYYTDDVYVEYFDGGYHLCNPYYPGARLGISVVI